MSSGPSNPIRREIRDCALFIPVISANTASRHEGYFRLEWDLADQRMGRRRKRDKHLLNAPDMRTASLVSRPPPRNLFSFIML
jgi:hypothetical protein